MRQERPGQRSEKGKAQYQEAWETTWGQEKRKHEKTEVKALFFSLGDGTSAGLDSGGDCNDGSQVRPYYMLFAVHVTSFAHWVYYWNCFQD